MGDYDEEQFYEQPCVVMTILNAYTFRCAIEMLGDIDGKYVKINFYSTYFEILQSSENKKRGCGVKIKKKDLKCYTFNPAHAYEGDDEKSICYTVILSVIQFCNAFKSDKKRKIDVEIYLSQSTDKCHVCFHRIKTGESVDRICGTYSVNESEINDVQDMYSTVYSTEHPLSIIEDCDFVDELNMYKGKKCEVTFLLRPEGGIQLRAIDDGILTTSNLDLNPDCFQAEEIDYDYSVILSSVDIADLTKISKIGQYNAIKIYLSLDQPLLIRAKILNYGYLNIWYES